MELELRPLSAGEVLDRTFQLFRARFGMFVGIATIAAAIRVGGSALQLGSTQFLARHGYGHALATVWTSASSLISICISLLAFSVVFAAITAAVMALHLGQPTGIAASYRQVLGRWFRYVRLSVAVGFLSMWPLLIVLGIFVAEIVAAPRVQSPQSAAYISKMFGFTALEMVVAAPLCAWLLCRYALSTAASVVEDLAPWRSIQRSVALSKDLRWRIFLLLLLVYVIQTIFAVSLVAPAVVFIVRARGHLSMGLLMYELAVGFVVTALTSPVYGIGLSVIYMDARIRKEGYDIELMIQRSGEGAAIGTETNLPGDAAPMAP